MGKKDKRFDDYIAKSADFAKPKILISYIKEAAILNDKGIRLPLRGKNTEKTEWIIPDYFIKELSKSKTAHKIFEDFTPSHKNEYVEWIMEARTGETRDKRMAIALKQRAEGKSRHWKYERPKPSNKTQHNP